MKNSLVAGVAALALAGLTALPAQAQDTRTFAIVVKAMDNPFFDLVRDGCMKAQAEMAGDNIECLYIGPAAHVESDQVQIIDDLLTRGVDAMAISPSNAPAVANLLRRRGPDIPVITIDADLLPEHSDLRITYVGTDNYDLGRKLGEELADLKPDGGTVCLLSGGPAADNLNRRIQGTRDVLSGGSIAPGERLSGENGWTEVAGCPLYTNDDAVLGVQMMTDILSAHGDLDAFVLEGGWPQFAPAGYAELTDRYIDRLKSNDLIIVASDTLDPQITALTEGRSQAQIGQRPFEMGYRTMFVLQDLVDGESVADAIYTGLDECRMDNHQTCRTR